MPKIRLDALLVQRGLAREVAEARGLILSGTVYAGTARIDKPGQPVAPDIGLTIKRKKDHPWVSRGGVKLAHALQYFVVNPAGMTALDIGASTGGFTDVLLTYGAARVYAVDVGYGELAWKLRQDARVVKLERTNARHLTAEMIPEKMDIVVCDASFISLMQILPRSLSFAKHGAYLLALIKPQFEAAKEEVGEGGIVRDPIIRDRICARVRSWLAEQPGWSVLGVTESPIAGTDGNKEFLIGGRYAGNLQ